MQKKDTCTNDGRQLGLQKGRSKILDNKKSILVEKIKNVIIDVVYYSDYKPKTKFSDYLRKKLNLDYTYLANVFSEQNRVNY